MKELLRTNDAVLLSVVEAMFDSENVGYLVADRHMSVLEGSAGFLTRRVLVVDDDFTRAKHMLMEANLGHELRAE